jgi:hypothetical protein
VAHDIHAAGQVTLDAAQSALARLRRASSITRPIVVATTLEAAAAPGE